MLKRLIAKLLGFALLALRVFPVKKRAVVFRSANGEKYICNPKYITEYILQNCPEEFRIIWLFNSPEKYEGLKERGITVCRSNSLKAIYYLSTAKYIVDNIAPVSYIPYRKSQRVINTWHGGGAYKKGFVDEKDVTKNRLTKQMGSTDYYISSCRVRSELIMNKWGFEEKQILPFGMARNDMFFRPTDEVTSKVKDALKIPQEKGIALYLPTFRHYVNGPDLYAVDCEKVTGALEKRYGKPFVLLHKLHFLIEGRKTILEGEDAVNVNGYEDVQELIAAADVVITDYSSVMWDAAVAKKPCFIFALDLDMYIEKVGFDTPIEEWPFPISQSNDELCKTIETLDMETYQKAVQQHLEALGSYENGTAAKQIAELMLSGK